MAKNKGTRIIVTLKCTECNTSITQTETQSRTSKQIAYTTKKNRRNTPDRIELRKFCPKCNRHTLHKEIK